MEEFILSHCLEENFMQAKLTQTFVSNVSPSDKLLRIRDTYTKGLVLFVNTGGKKTYFIDFRRSNGKRADYKIGDATRITVAEARDITSKFLAAIDRGEDPTEPDVAAVTLGGFIKDIYEPWILEHRKSGKSSLAMIKLNFEHLYDTPLDQVSVALIEQWRSKKKKDKGVKSSSLNRMVTALKAAVNWAVKRGIIESNPLAKLESLSEKDLSKKTRYLTEDERLRLMTALNDREKEIKQKRESHNEWLKERGLETFPCIKEGDFADHLKPLILLALSTGIRRNSLLSLEWGDINFNERTIFVRADVDKTEKERYVPL